MSIGMMLISVELLMMLFILLHSGRYAGPVYRLCHRESLGAAALRIAGGISPKSPTSAPTDEIVFRSNKTTRAKPGVIAGLYWDNEGDSVGPSVQKTGC